MENLVRLYRGDGDLLEATGSNDRLTKGGPTPVQFEPAIISGRNREVFSFIGGFDMYSHTIGSTGIPGGMEERTMAVWINMNCCAQFDLPIAGYGRYTSNNMFQLTNPSTKDGYRIDVIHNDVFNDRTHGKFGGPEYYIHNEWLHLAVTMDDRYITVYINGTKVKEGRTRDPFNTIVPGEIWVGGPGKAYRSFRGKIADFAIFDKALSPEKIEDIVKFGFSDNGDLFTPVSLFTFAYCILCYDL